MTTWQEIPRRERYSRNDMIIYECEAEILGAVAAARAELGLSQKELAERCGVKQPAIARLESPAHSPYLINILKVLVPLGYVLKVEKIEK